MQHLVLLLFQLPFFFLSEELLIPSFTSTSAVILSALFHHSPHYFYRLQSMTIWKIMRRVNVAWLTNPYPEVKRMKDVSSNVRQDAYYMKRNALHLILFLQDHMSCICFKKLSFFSRAQISIFQTKINYTAR